MVFLTFQTFLQAGLDAVAAGMSPAGISDSVETFVLSYNFDNRKVVYMWKNLNENSEAKKIMKGIQINKQEVKKIQIKKIK